MIEIPTTNIELLRTAYAAFNARDADATLATMSADIALPNGMEGGYVYGHQAVRAYWKRQWAIIYPHDEPVAFYVETSDCILVDVHQIIRNLAGTVISDQHLRHRCTIENSLIQTVEVCSLPISNR